MSFTIREVLWLTAVVALGFSWWIDNKRIEKTISKITSEQAELTEELKDKLTILNDWNKQHGNQPSGYVSALQRAWGTRNSQNSTFKTRRPAMFRFTIRDVLGAI